MQKISLSKEFNPRSKTTWDNYLACGVAEGFEESSGFDQTVEAWAYLISTGLAWQLQGWFGRAANELIEKGLIDRSGHISWAVVDRGALNA